MLGFGGVGRALAAQMCALGRRSRLRLCAIVDRSGYVFVPAGLGPREVARLVNAKAAGQSLGSLGTAATPDVALDFIAAHAAQAPVLADVTADETGLLLARAAARGRFDLVLANKKPLAGPQRAVDTLLAAVAAAGRTLRCEATVGAGLPVIASLDGLIASGDRVRSIDGCASGTLAFVLGALESGRALSDAVREARERGWTEPDPRDDLSGRDAARKALILARKLGYRGAPPRAEDLVPRSMRGLSVAAFLQALPRLDGAFRARAEQAARRGRVLRYVIHASPRAASARLAEVPKDSPLGHLRGTDNLFAFRTRHYPDAPLVIQGPGAGPARTAAAVLTDLQALPAR
ncbi:MAG: homoserine dehydrogenase [Vicinamibacteria bacterium]|nr:homoserine dehydrogenase [Vicinamibacteria bacterium]